MKYALNLGEDDRILSATYPQYAPKDAVVVDELPEGNIAHYLYVDGEFIYSPLEPVSIVMEPTQLDIIEAQVAYTAMMTNTLLEV